MRSIGLACVAVLVSACFDEPDPQPGEDTMGSASSNASGDDASTGGVGMSSMPVSEGEATSSDDGVTTSPPADSTAGDSGDPSDGGDATTGAQEVIVLDLWADACTWDWTDQLNVDLPCPGTVRDEQGYVVPASRSQMLFFGEQNRVYTQGAIAIHPPFTAPSETRGLSTQLYEVETGDTFRATVGCAATTDCDVTITFRASGTKMVEDTWVEQADDATQELE